ncbi:MAG: hypothetical protein U0270_29505 [Labilithrix sp.]
MRAILSIPVAFIAIASLTLACGNNAEQPPPASPTSAPAGEAAKGSGEAAHHGGGHHEGGGHEDHGKMKPELHAFHETLAPIWHTNPGNDRVAKACGGQGDLTAKAAAVGDAELTASVEAVKTACGTPDKKDVESKLSTVHDRFHKLAEQK